MRYIRRKKIFRFMVLLLIINFIFVQNSSFADTQIQFNQDSGNLQPVKSIAEFEQSPTEVIEETVSPTSDFLNESPLSIPTKEELIAVDTAYEYERYEFIEALDLLREDYAGAVIVKSLSIEDLNALARLPFETGIIVLYGEIVLFTSGSGDEIGVLPAVKDLFNKASFISHTHTEEFSKEGPSGKDLELAVAAPSQEYVVTHQGVYAYNNEGVINDDPYSYEWYLERLNEAQSLQSSRNDVLARADLNRFIAEQDRYNEAPEAEKEILRLSGTWSYTSGLTTSNVTTLPGSPIASIAPGLSGVTTFSYDSPSGILSSGYSVPNLPDYSGIVISFDNPGTTTVESQNLTTLSYLIFGLKGPNTSVRFDIFDVNNVMDSFTFIDISNTTEQFWRIPVSAIASLDKTRVQRMIFYISQSNTTSTTRSGTLNVRSYGINIPGPSQPVVTSTVPVATNQNTLVVSGTKEANTAILVNGTQVVALNSSTTWSTT